VTLIWQGSKSPGKGYNAYRGTKSGGSYSESNPDLVQGLSNRDRDVQSGTTDYYVTRAVDADGFESVNSSEGTATIPSLPVPQSNGQLAAIGGPRAV